MRILFILCVLILGSCKKEELKKQYKVTAKCDKRGYEKEVTYVIYEGEEVFKHPQITKKVGEQAEYDFEDDKPREVHVWLATAINPGESVFMAYYENGRLLDSITFTNRMYDRFRPTYGHICTFFKKK